MTDWINVNDVLPESPGRYLVLVGNAQIEIAECRQYAGGLKFFSEKHDTGLPLTVSHWMRLPSIPS